MNYLIFGGIWGLLLLAFYIFIKIQIGIYVYKDAGNRGYQQKGLYTAAAVIIPFLIGFIGYLIIVKSAASKQCEKCQRSIGSNVKYCPFCGAESTKNAPVYQADQKKIKQILILIVIFLAVIFVTYIAGQILLYSNPEIYQVMWEWERALEAKFYFLD